MIAKEDILELLKSTESYRVERTISTGNMDKFCEAICAFANDMPGSRKNGYLIIGAKDNGSIAGMKVDDALLKKIAGIRSDGNILPLPAMSVERFHSRKAIYWLPKSDHPIYLLFAIVVGYLFVSGLAGILRRKQKREYLRSVAVLSWQPLTRHLV